MAAHTVALTRQLEELHLLQCSLLPSELFSFILPPEAHKEWTDLLDTRADFVQTIPARFPSSPCRFEVRPDDAHVWFEVELPNAYPEDGGGLPMISVKGENMGRSEQETWQEIVKSNLAELEGSDFLVYQLLSLHLLPRLHEQTQNAAAAAESMAHTSQDHAATPEPLYHALLTSHHLVSPTKRRSMQKWTADLSLSGFAKVGHPGVIYCEGVRGAVEDFVAKVKAMQWLGLRVRFVESVDPSSGSGYGKSERRWVELEKVGEVVDEMRRIGREECVLEMGIGSVGAGVSK